MRVGTVSEKTSIREIVAPLLTDEKAILKRIVDTSLDILRLDESTGDLVLIAPRSKITDKHYVALLLLARYLAFRAGLGKTDSMTVTDLIQKSGINEGTVSSRLSDLRAERIVEAVSRGEYRISYSNAERLVREVGAELTQQVEPTKPIEPYAKDAFPKIERPSGVRDAILKVLSTPWGKHPRTWREIYEALKSNEYYYGEGNISGSLTQLVNEVKKVRRVKFDGKSGYVLTKGGE